MSDEATQKNILAILDHSNRTREIVRELEKKLDESNRAKSALMSELSLLQQQVSGLLVKIYSGGATGGN